jgi:SAM-dependent methyltransferase
MATHTADVVALPFEDGTFDLVVCSHVLEHVVDDRAAMAELLRVLRPEGRALLLQPVHDELPRTIEDPTITEPAERLRAFGQRDHVRIYGRDFVPRLQETGFDVGVVDYVDSVDPETVRRCGLGPELIYVGTKALAVPSGPSRREVSEAR